MNNSLRWKLILAFVLVFLAGAACGFFGAFHVHHFFARMDSGAMAQHLKHRLRAELKLTPEQMQKISRNANKPCAMFTRFLNKRIAKCSHFSPRNSALDFRNWRSGIATFCTGTV
jgi:hypothetical protein